MSDYSGRANFHFPAFPIRSRAVVVVPQSQSPNFRVPVFQHPTFLSSTVWKGRYVCWLTPVVCRVEWNLGTRDAPRRFHLSFVLWQYRSFPLSGKRYRKCRRYPRAAVAPKTRQEKGQRTGGGGRVEGRGSSNSRSEQRFTRGFIVGAGYSWTCFIAFFDFLGVCEERK